MTYSKIGREKTVKYNGDNRIYSLILRERTAKIMPIRVKKTELKEMPQNSSGQFKSMPNTENVITTLAGPRYQVIT